jgi:peptidoglycan/xylan/chitin deacetylase (PgdA/CDA1 family)
MSRRLLVLGWHNIEPTWAFPGPSAEAGRRGFERQVRFLRRWTNVVPLRSALTDLAAGRPLPPRAVALTFDDGYLDNATFAAPLLHSEGLPATFFLVPEFLAGTSAAWWEILGRAVAQATVPTLRWAGERYDLTTPAARRIAADALADSLKTVDSRARADAVAELGRRLLPDGNGAPPRLFMTWDEADALPGLGHDIGSHTCGHPILSRETEADQKRELVASREALEARFGRPVDVLAFPNGRRQDYSDVTLDLVHAAGYEFAVTTRTALAGPRSAPAEIPRVLVDPATDLREVVRGGLRVLRRVVSRISPGHRGAVT